MLVTEILTILRNIPMKHVLAMILGFLLLACISILGSKDFKEEDKISELIKPLMLSSLSEDYQIEIP